jgi:cobalt/nickel transport system permease protein
MNSDRIVRVAMASSVFFLASLINIKVGPSSTHLSLIGPIGILLGWSAFPAIFTALLLQAVLFQFGGILVLGANTASMGTAAVIVHLLFGKMIRGGSLKIAAAAAFAAGFLAVLLGAGFVGLFLALSDPGMATAAKTMLAVHVPLGLIEGAAALFMTVFLKRTFPDVLGMAE